MNKLRRNKDHRVRLAKGLHVFKSTDRGKWLVVYRPPGEKSRTLYYEDAYPSRAALRAMYESHVRGGEPLPARDRPAPSAVGTWGAAIDIYERDELPTLARPGAYTSVIAYLREQCGDRLMRKYTAVEVEDMWTALHRTRGHGAANGLRTVLSKVTTIGKKRGWTNGQDLMGDVKKIGSKIAFRPWHAAEVERWRAFYPDHASIERLALEILFELGLRGRSDGTRLSWADTRIDPEASARADLPADTLWIRFEQQKIKGKSGAIVDRPILGDDLLECLRHCPQAGDVVGVNGLSTTPWLLNPVTGQPFNPNTFSVWWRKWAKVAGMRPDFTPHGARKMQATDAATIGVPANQGRKLTGHTLEMWAHYSEQAEGQTLAGSAAKILHAGRTKRRAA